MRPSRRAPGSAARPTAGAAPFRATVFLLLAACGAPRDGASRAESATAPGSAAALGSTTAIGSTAAGDVLSSADSARATGAGGPARPDSAAPESMATSLSGFVDVVGNAPVSRVIVRIPEGREVVVTGDAAPLLRGLAGLEVTAEGQGEGEGEGGGRAFRASRFVVRAADGQPAHDGRLERIGDRWTLTASDGVARPLADPPPQLREYAGRRVWLVLGDDGRVTRYGLIE